MAQDNVGTINCSDKQGQRGLGLQNQLPSLPVGLAGELAAVVGSDWVRLDRSAIDEFKDPFWIPGDETYAASAVVQPATVEQVQSIMRIANRYGVPVSPHSQGKNLGHGGASPRQRGSIQLGFQRMNEILEINEDMAYAVVEPGVTWADLHEQVRERDFDLMTPAPDLSWGSIIGNSMDSGHTYQQYGADYQMPTGFEVVLPDGELLRTGQGGIPEGKAWHVYKRSLGPSLDDLFVQSNLGIVVRMGVWLKRRPAAYAPLVMVIDEDRDLEVAIDAIRELRLAGHLEGIPSIYSTLRASHMLLDEPVAARPDPFSPEELKEIGQQKHVGAWAVRAAVWGEPEIVEAKIKHITRNWNSIPSGWVYPVEIYPRGDEKRFKHSAQLVTLGIPTLKAIESTPDHVAHLDVSPVVPLQGSAIREVVEEIRSQYAAAGLNFGVGIMVSGERSAVAIAGIRYDRTDADSCHAAFGLGRKLVASLGALGYGDSRPHLEFMDLAADVHSFNDHAYRRFVEKIKDAVDPNGILAPGRHGIWGSATRPEQTHEL